MPEQTPSAMKNTIQTLVAHNKTRLAEELLQTSLTDVQTLQYVAQEYQKDPTVTNTALLTCAARSTNQTLTDTLQSTAAHIIETLADKDLRFTEMELLESLLKNPCLTPEFIHTTLTKLVDKTPHPAMGLSFILSCLAENPSCEKQSLDMLIKYVKNHPKNISPADLTMSLFRNPNIDPNFLKNYILYPARNPLLRKLQHRPGLTLKANLVETTWEDNMWAREAAKNPGANPKHVKQLLNWREKTGGDNRALIADAHLDEKTITAKTQQLANTAADSEKPDVSKKVSDMALALLKNPNTPAGLQKQLVDIYVKQQAAWVGVDGWIHIEDLLQNWGLTAQTLEYVFFTILPDFEQGPWTKTISAREIVAHRNVTQKIAEVCQTEEDIPVDLYTVNCPWFELQNIPEAWKQANRNYGTATDKRNVEKALILALTQKNYSFEQLQALLAQTASIPELNLAVRCGLQLLAADESKTGQLFQTTAQKIYWAKIAQEHHIETKTITAETRKPSTVLRGVKNKTTNIKITP